VYTTIRRCGQQHPLLKTLSSLKTTRAWKASIIRPSEGVADNIHSWKLLIVLRLQEPGRLVYYMVIKERGRQQSLYGHQRPWPTTFTHKAHCRKCPGRQVPKLKSTQADKYLATSNKPTSPLPLHWEQTPHI